MGSNLEKFFLRIGARVKVVEILPFRPRWQQMNPRQAEPRVFLNIGRDKYGIFFEIRTIAGANQELLILNSDLPGKHLLLLSRQFDEQGKLQAKQKFLCGQDEGHWFVAAIPENQAVSTVADAQIALKPEEVRTREEALGVTREQGFRRRNAAFVRQGEWFFIPAGDIQTDPLRLLRNEPISRGNGGKPHWAEQCYRMGGETVYVSTKYPRGLTATEYNRLPPSEHNRGFRMMKRDATVFVRGEITHRDHKTVYLKTWHRVLMNTENRSKAMRFLAFLD